MTLASAERAADSVLPSQYGAKAIFDDKEAEANAINYTESDVEALLTRTAEPLPEAEQDSAGAFAHAKIWEKSGKLEDVVIEEVEETGENLHGFWAGILDKQEAEERRRKAEAAANVGRGKRSRATVSATPIPFAPQLTDSLLRLTGRLQVRLARQEEEEGQFRPRRVRR